MLLELGPVAIDDVRGWSRLSRRLAVELRAVGDPDDQPVVSEEFLKSWSELIDALDGRCRECDEEFRWSQIIDNDQAEFLLHGLERCLRSSLVRTSVTPAEATCHRPFTLHFVESMTTGLVVEGRGCEHYLDEARSALDF